MIQGAVLQQRPLTGGAAFYGRTAELAALNACYKAFQKGEPGAGFIITGEPGVGKSALMRQWLRGLDKGCIKISVANYRIEQSFPYKLWGSVCGQIGTMAESGRLNISQEQLLLMRQMDLYPDGGDALYNADHTKEVTKKEAFVLRLMGYLCSQRPVVLAIDDFQWVDDQSLYLLSLVLTHCSRIMLALATKDGGADGGKSLHNGFAEKHPLATVHLERFSLDETRNLIRQLAPDHYGACEQIYRESEGNAFFITEVLHNLSAGLQADMPNPNINAFISAHLSRLDKSVMATANIIAAMQGDMSLRLLQIVSGSDVSELVDAVDTLLEQGVLRETTDARGNLCYCFTHQKLRDYVYSGISRSKRILLHGKIAAGLEALCAQHNEGHLCMRQLIYHYTLADNLYKVVGLRLDRQERIVKRRNEMFRLDVVKPIWDVDFEDDAAGGAQEELSEIAALIDSPALMCSKEELTRIRFRYAYLLGRYHYSAGRPVQGRAAMADMLRYAREMRAESVLADAYIRMIFLFMDENDLPQAERYIALAESMGAVRRDPKLATIAGHYKAIIYLRRNQPEACASLLRENIAALAGLPVEYGATAQLASDYYTLSTALLTMNRLDEAEDCLRLAGEYCRGMHTEASSAVIKLNLGMLHYKRAEYAQALPCLLESELFFRQQDFWENKGSLYAYLVLVLLRLGRKADAFLYRPLCQELLASSKMPLERAILEEALAKLDVGL